jgi:hypothetical protein
MMLRCNQVARLLSEAQDQPLTLGLRWRLTLHLGMCGACSRFKQQLGFMRKAARQAPRKP